MRARRFASSAQQRFRTDLAALGQALGEACAALGLLIAAAAALLRREAAAQAYLLRRRGRAGWRATAASIADYFEDQAPWLVDAARELRANPRRAAYWTLGLAGWAGAIALIVVDSAAADFVAGAGALGAAALFGYFTSKAAAWLSTPEGRAEARFAFAVAAARLAGWRRQLVLRARSGAQILHLPIRR